MASKTKCLTIPLLQLYIQAANPTLTTVRTNLALALRNNDLASCQVVDAKQAIYDHDNVEIHPDREFREEWEKDVVLGVAKSDGEEEAHKFKDDCAIGRENELSMRKLISVIEAKICTETDVPFEA
jgi:hypothetical protein